MKIETKKNGFEGSGIQAMIAVFNKAAENLFPECKVEHFYYGEGLSMTDLSIAPNHYAHFSISKDRVGLGGYTCSFEELEKFKSMTHNDELYKGKLLQIAG